MRKKILLSLFIIVAVLAVSGCGCKEKNPNQYRMTLEVWGTEDDSLMFSEIFDTYTKINPNVTRVEYKKLALDTYKKELIEALASGQGPDIFLIHNTWLANMSSKIVPAPAEVLGEQKYRQDFVDVAANDFIEGGQIWAAPLSVDSLGLYYNKDLFNSAGITNPPKNWDEFVEDVVKLTKIDASGEIIRSGAAIGTAYNINRSTDILNLLLLQNGTEMYNDTGRFSLSGSSGGQTVASGENALSFYTQFAKLGTLNSWNRNMHYSIDAFSEGVAAMMLNYSWHVETVKSKAPKLNFAVAPVPQFEGSLPVNYANYWAFAVAKNKNINPDSPGVTDAIRTKEAWKFITYLTTNPGQSIEVKSNIAGTDQIVKSGYDPAAIYAEKTRKPAARRDLIEKQKTDPVIGVFAKDNLIARSWRQKDPDATEAIFAEMIDTVNRGASTVTEAVQLATQRIGGLGR